MLNLRNLVPLSWQEFFLIIFAWTFLLGVTDLTTILAYDQTLTQQVSVLLHFVPLSETTLSGIPKFENNCWSFSIAPADDVDFTGIAF